MARLLNEIDALWIALGLLAAMLAVHELCWRWGRRAAASVGEGGREGLGTLDAAVSLLMGLLLAFSFSMAASRFTQRQGLVIAEANAIGTSYLRCALLEPAERASCETRLRHYLELRIAIHEAGYDLARLRDLALESERVLEDVWAGLVEASRRAGPSPQLSLVLAAMNQTIDLHGERVAAFRFHLPVAVTLLLLGLCLVWAAFGDYSLGHTGRRYRLGWTTFAVLIAVVVYVTFDFDRQQRGFIRLDTASRSLYDLRASMARGGGEEGAPDPAADARSE